MLLGARATVSAKAARPGSWPSRTSSASGTVENFVYISSLNFSTSQLSYIHRPCVSAFFSSISVRPAQFSFKIVNIKFCDFT